MNISRPVLLFAAPRSGSSMIYHYLGESLKKAKGWAALDEFFEIYHHSFRDTGSGIVNETTRRSGPLDTPDDAQVAALEVRRAERAALLRRYPDAYTLKVLPEHLNLEILLWLLQHYEWIFLERRDVLAQVLSFLKSDLTHFARGPDPESMTATRKAFNRIEQYILFWRKLKKVVGPRHVMDYETFCELGPDRFLGSLGLPPVASDRVIRKADPSEAQKRLARFVNADEILDWYNASPISRESSEDIPAKNVLALFEPEPPIREWLRNEIASHALNGASACRTSSNPSNRTRRSYPEAPGASDC